MTDAPVRRVGFVLVVYGGVAWLVLSAAEWFATTFALPELFGTLLVGGLLVGVPVAALVAWHYPDIGNR